MIGHGTTGEMLITACVKVTSLVVKNADQLRQPCGLQHHHGIFWWAWKAEAVATCNSYS